MAKKKLSATHTTWREIKLDLDIDFYILNSKVFTTSNLSKIDKTQKNIKGKRYLCISIEVQLDEFESLIDGAAYARPRFLIILGLLSFFTHELFTPFDFHNSYSLVRGLERANEKRLRFKYSGYNFQCDLKRVIEFINSGDENDKRLFYSLVDRYRKALFLEKESEENMIHDDEILLSYFHILELLSTKYYPKQKQQAAELIKEFSKTVLNDVYLLEGNQLSSEVSSKNKLIESIFITEIPVASKIMYMLQEQGILSYRLKSLIADIVKDRNSVAHGRLVYQERVIFPIPPFFPLIRNRGYSLEMLRILTGRAIALFIGLDHLDEEWLDFELFPTIDELNNFINEKRYEKVSIDDFYAGVDNDITPLAITYYLINKKLSIEKVTSVLSNVIVNYRESEDEITQLIIAVVLIVDQVSPELKQKCKDIIKLSSSKGWLPNFKMRDILYYLEYNGHEPKLLREMITARDVR